MATNVAGESQGMGAWGWGRESLLEQRSCIYKGIKAWRHGRAWHVGVPVGSPEAGSPGEGQDTRLSRLGREGSSGLGSHAREALGKS